MFRTIAVALLAAAAVSADIITMKDGRVIEGEVIENDGVHVKVKLKHGALTLDRDKVESIEEKATPEQEYVERVKKLDASDLKQQIALAEWAESVKLDDEAIVHYVEAAKLDPDAAVPKLALEQYDWHFFEGKWTDADHYHQAQGWVRYEGRWIHPLEYGWHLSQQIRAKLEEQLSALKARISRAHASGLHAKAAREAAGRAIESKKGQREEAEADLPQAEADIKAFKRTREDVAKSVDRAQWFYDQERLRQQRGEANALATADADLRRAKKNLALADFDLSQAESRVAQLDRLISALGAGIDAAEKAQVKAEKDEKEAADEEAEAGAGLHELEEQAAAARAEEDKAKASWEKVKGTK